MARLLLISLFFFGLVALFAPISCGNEPEKLVLKDDAGQSTVKEAEKPAELLQELRDVRYSQSKKGRLQWELVAESVEQAEDGPVSLEKVEIKYYSNDGRVIFLTADAGLYESATRDVELRGNVVVETPADGDRLRTEVLRWNQESETIEGEGDVTMTRGGSVIKGKGFELSPETETFKIYNVEGTILQEDLNL